MSEYIISLKYQLILDSMTTGKWFLAHYPLTDSCTGLSLKMSSSRYFWGIWLGPYILYK